MVGETSRERTVWDFLDSLHQRLPLHFAEPPQVQQLELESFFFHGNQQMLTFLNRPDNLVNSVFWIAILLVAGWSWYRSLTRRDGPVMLTATLMSLLAFAVVLLALRLAYVAPLAIIQDIVAAREALKGKPLPTIGIQPLVEEALTAEERPASLTSVWPWLADSWPSLSKQEQQEHDAIPNHLKVQAHPPFATMFTVPFVYFLGVYDTGLIISLLSIGCFTATLFLVYRGLDFALSTSHIILVSAVLLGWYPMFEALRSVQLGALLGLLVVIGWYGIQRNRLILAGVAVGVAASLKLFPGLLLIYFLLRYRRACWAGVATIVILNAATMAIFGVQSYLDYLRTARFVAGNWGDNRQNWSLLTTLHHFSDILSVPALSSRTAFLAVALVFVAIISWLVWVVRPTRAITHVEYSIFVVSMTLLSPTCWSHYFVMLILPLAVLANHVKSAQASSLLFLALFLVIATPDGYAKLLPPLVEPYVGQRASIALLLPPSLARLGMILWLAIPAWTSSCGLDEPPAKAS